MRRVRALLAAFITICGLLSGSIEVTAAGVRGMEIQSEDTAVRKGQEITLTFALDGYTDIRDGVNALKGTLEFDSDVFEEASGEDFETLNSWERMFYNPDNGQFVLINRGREHGRGSGIPSPPDRKAVHSCEGSLYYSKRAFGI